MRTSEAASGNSAQLNRCRRAGAGFSGLGHDVSGSVSAQACGVQHALNPICNVLPLCHFAGRRRIAIVRPFSRRQYKERAVDRGYAASFAGKARSRALRTSFDDPPFHVREAYSKVKKRKGNPANTKEIGNPGTAYRGGAAKGGSSPCSAARAQSARGSGPARA